MHASRADLSQAFSRYRSYPPAVYGGTAGRGAEKRAVS